MPILCKVITEFCVFEISGPDNVPRGFLSNGVPEVRHDLKLRSTAPILEVIEGPAFYEEVDYTFTIQSRVREHRLSLKHRVPSFISGIKRIPNVEPQTLTGIVRFRQSVGWTDFHVTVGSDSLSVSLEVFPTKLDYYRDYQAMLKRVRDFDRLLCLRYFAETYQSLAIESGASSRLDWLSILRAQVSDLEIALRYANEHPLTVLEPTLDFSKLERIARPDLTTLVAIARGQGMGAATDVAGIGAVHSSLPIVGAIHSFDCVEHRWISSQLGAVRTKLRLLRDELLPSQRQNPANAQRDFDGADEVAEIGALESRIGTLLGLDILRSSRDRPVPVHFSSLRLAGSAGYAAAYALLLSLNHGLSASVGAIDISVDKLGTLYEVWCFVEVVSILQDKYGDPSDASTAELVEGTRLGTRISDGIPIRFNFRFHGDSTVEVCYHGSFRSWTGTHKPDIVITIRKPGWPEVLVILDAKYRLNLDSKARDAFGIVPPPQEAINALHRYRDAIVIRKSDHLPLGRKELTEAVRPVSRGAALYPLPEEESKGFLESALWAALEKQGIGAIPMLPGNTSHFTEWVTDLFTVPVEKLSVAFPPHGNSEFVQVGSDSDWPDDGGL